MTVKTRKIAANAARAVAIKSTCIFMGALLWTCSALAIEPVAGVAAVTPEALVVPTGQTLLLRYPRVKRVSAGDGQLVDVKVFSDTEEVMLMGKTVGVTDLRIWNRDGTSSNYVVKVVSPNPPAPVPGLQAEPTILIKAKLLEVKKSVLRDIGVDWADSAQGPTFGAFNEYLTNKYFRVIPGGVAQGLNGFQEFPANVGPNNYYLGFTSTIESAIKMLVSNGDARMLAEPTLTCISGGAADFLVGGELPIPVVDSQGRTSVEFKQFGIILNIQPQSNEAGLIRTKLKVEVSSVDTAIAVLGIPGFATRKTNTEMNLQSGATMVVAGLYSAEEAKTVVKVPGLGSIPILGELFKSRQFKKGDTELIVLVSPEVVTTDSAVMKQGIRQFDELQQRADKALKFKMLD